MGLFRAFVSVGLQAVTFSLIGLIVGCTEGSISHSDPGSVPSRQRAQIGTKMDHSWVALSSARRARIGQRVLSDLEAVAATALKNGQLATARRHYMTLQEFRPNDLDLLLTQRRIIALLGAMTPEALQEQEANEFLSVRSLLIQVDPDRAHIYETARANMSLRSGSPKVAIGILRAVTKASPKYPFAYLGLARAHIALGETEVAEEVLRGALVAGVSSTLELRSAVGHLRMEEQDYVGAIKQYEEALLESPPSAQLHTLLGNALTKNKQLDKAEKHFQDAIQLDPTQSEAYDKLGVIYYDTQRVKEAIEMLEKAYQISEDGTQLYKLALVLMTAKQFDRALSFLKRLSETNPKSADVQIKIAEVYEKTGKTAEAVAEYRKGLEKLRKDPSKRKEIAALRIRIDELANQIGAKSGSLNPPAKTGWRPRSGKSESNKAASQGSTSGSVVPQPVAPQPGTTSSPNTTIRPGSAAPSSSAPARSSVPVAPASVGNPNSIGK